MCYFLYAYLDVFWLAERTEKIPMGSIKNVVTEPIEGHEDYHMMVRVYHNIFSFIISVILIVLVLNSTSGKCIYFTYIFIYIYLKYIQLSLVLLYTVAC